MAYFTGTRRQAYQDIAAGTANIIYLTDWDDIATSNDKVGPVQIFGSVDQAGDLLISSAVYDAATVDDLETGTLTGVAKGGTDACTNGAPSATALAAATATFQSDGVVAGDIASNATTGEQAIIVTVTDETNLVTEAITSDWTAADNVDIITGTATVMTDSAATFQTNLVYPGCILKMDVSEEIARVVSVTSETALVCTAFDQNFLFEEAYTVLDPFTFTILAGRTYTAIANGEQPLNDLIELPFADGYKIELSKGGHLTVVYDTNLTVYPT